MSSDVVFVLLGLNCLTHKVSSIIPTASSMPWSPRETSAHTLLLFSVSFPALPWALRCALCTPTCLLETPSTGVGALELKIYFFILFLSMCICEGGRVMCTRVWTAAEDRRGQPTEDTLEPSGTTWHRRSELNFSLKPGSCICEASSLPLSSIPKPCGVSFFSFKIYFFILGSLRCVF